VEVEDETGIEGTGALYAPALGLGGSTYAFVCCWYWLASRLLLGFLLGGTGCSVERELKDVSRL
jgi:hypothetical protein